MALEFGSPSLSSPFIFGLMNEPHDLEVSVWVDAAQRAIEAIRATGAKNPIFVPGADWTTANDFAWSANSKLLQTVTDPGDNFAIEVHQYFDGTCTPNGYVDKLAPFEAWAVANNRVAFLGELDVTDDTAACKEAFKNLIEHLHAKAAGTTGGVWIGYTYWEGKEVSKGLPFIEPHLPTSCANLAADGEESDVDCGSTCLRCAAGKTCSHDYDCQSGTCTAGICAATPAWSGDAGIVDGSVRADIGGSGATRDAAQDVADSRPADGAKSGSNAESSGRSGSQSSGVSGSSSGSSGSRDAAGRSGSTGAPEETGEDAPTQTPAGCGCRIASPSANSGWLGVLTLLSFVALRRAPKRQPTKRVTCK